MKRVLLIIALFIILLSSSCRNIKISNSELAENTTYEEEEINYEIEQILFSKSFQSVDPAVEIITKNNKLKILASLGLSEHTDVNIERIVKKGNEVNIHVSGTTNKKNLRLAVPQVIMELKKENTKNINDIKFNIVYDNYKPVKIKFCINDILNKVQAHFKVSLKSMPEFSLIKNKDTVIWNIKYNSVFVKEEPGIPLVNLTAKVDANDGKIIESEKTYISSFLDNGHILNYIPEKYILYKKTIKDDETNNILEQLWSYDILNEKKTLIYSSHYKISLAEFSPDLKYISLIEINDQNSDLFVISKDDLKPYKVFFEDNFYPKSICWSKDNILYLIDNADRTTVYSYDIENHMVDLIGTINKKIENFITMDNKFLILEKNQNEFNYMISLTTDWSSFQNLVLGFKPKVINENLISYLNKDDKNDTNILVLFDLKDKKVVRKIKENILNYDVLPDGNISYVNKNTDNNNFTLFKYSIEDRNSSQIANFIGDKVYYSEDKNTVYLNIMLPFENEKTEAIYTIDLTKLN